MAEEPERRAETAERRGWPRGRETDGQDKREKKCETHRRARPLAADLRIAFGGPAMPVSL